MPSIKLTVAYDGGGYLGWQKTSMGPSIEQALEEVIAQILQENNPLQAASRTDAGVHAKGQIVNFTTQKLIHDLNKFKVSLNCLLPKDIAIMKVEEVPIDFHPTLDCTGKEYHYMICNAQAQMPHYRHFSWHYPHKLDINAMREAVPTLIGEKDFSTFCNFKKNSSYAHYVRRIESINILEIEEDRLRIEINGNNFLYKMVRNLVGTLVYIGCGKIPIDQLKDIVNSHDRTKAGMTAPAHGLCLNRIFYHEYMLHDSPLSQ